MSSSWRKTSISSSFDAPPRGPGLSATGRFVVFKASFAAAEALFVTPLVALWAIAQGFGVYNDLARTPVVTWVANLLFCFWFAPLAMAVFLDPEHETGRIDTILVLDFVQAMLICIAAYVYFFYLPKSDSSTGLSHEVWAPYFGGYALVALAFVLRSIFAHSRDVRVLFGSMGLFLSLSGCADALYYYGPGETLKTGQWFDLLWSILLVLPIVIATAWKHRFER